MASTIIRDLASPDQDLLGDLAALRKSGIAKNTDDAKVPTAESSGSSSPAAEKKKKSKATKDSDGKKTSNSKSSGKKCKSKSKKGRKVLIIDDKSTSSEESNCESSSEELSESGSDLRDVKSRSSPRKGKAKKLGKPGKKRTKSAETNTDTDDSDAETHNTTNAVKDKKDKTDKDVGLLQQQLQLVTRQVQELMRNQTVGLGLGSLGGVPLGNPYLSGNPALQFSNPVGLNANAIQAVSLGNLNNCLGVGQNLGSPRNDNYKARNTLNTHRSGRLDSTTRRNSNGSSLGDEDADEENSLGLRRNPNTKAEGGVKKGQPRLEYKRVDQVWDSTIHNFKLQDTAQTSTNSRYNEYLFHVRRTFDWEGKYKATVVDIKSKQLREALRDIIGTTKGLTLVEDTPKLDPNMLFLYLEDLREHMTNLKDLEPEGKDKKERKKIQKWIDQKRRHLRILIKYLDEDYAQVKKSLYPLLENGLITFDLCWALWKPNTLAYTTTYGCADEPRMFKVEMANKHSSMLKGDFFYVEGKYFEYDGKQFGYGSMAEEISDFRGARKITSLNCYPLKYHSNEAQVRKDLIERGKKFVSLAGSHYKSHKGLAYYKKKKAVIKVNINGRIMVDPSTHRRTNPNYPVSLVRPKDHDLLEDFDDSDEEGGCCGSDSDDEAADGGKALIDDEDRAKYVTKAIKDKDGNVSMVRISKDDLTSNDKDSLEGLSGRDDDTLNTGETSDENDDKNAVTRDFGEEEYLIASPVVLGFAFAEKLWLELSVSGVKEISWNDSAYDSLVLEPKTKDIVRALVESHKYHAAESIDDVIQGKGKGLVFVLHGPPGTGKTLTAEGISELLKCPLYNVSAGDLGTDSRLLEGELQRVLDICHAWGAILLLDEADVFLEKRNMHDIHRNALVSIFLRQLEYYQGILFLTTNRVETFDDAFQSRIHIALRYDELDTKAKKAIFKIFVERVRSLQEIPITSFTEEDYNTLARHDLNGRQIKNTIRTAQALAVNRGEPLGMKHIIQFLDVLGNFEKDLKGGPGYQDAMRSYF